MTVEKTNIDTLIVGGGQAGIAMSEHLTKLGISHLVIEKNRIAEAWRSGRWDSLVANGPAWHDRFPGMEFKGGNPDSFIPKDDVAEYFEDYVRAFNLPVRCSNAGSTSGFFFKIRFWITSSAEEEVSESLVLKRA